MAICLAPVNLGLEAARWRMCLAGVEVRSWRSHFAAVLAGISVGLPLTHLVGDYSSKLALARRHGAEAAPLLVASSFSQYAASLLGGLAAVWMLLFQGLLPARVEPLATALSFTLLLLLAGYFALPYVYRLARQLPFQWAAHLPAQVTWPSLPTLLFLSLLRYGIILSQYALLVKFFAPTGNMALYLAGTAVALGIKTLVPFLSIGGMIGLREVLAITVLGSLGFADASVLAVSLAVWAVNVALPALAGTTVLAKLRAPQWRP